MRRHRLSSENGKGFGPDPLINLNLKKPNETNTIIRFKEIERAIAGLRGCEVKHPYQINAIILNAIIEGHGFIMDEKAMIVDPYTSGACLDAPVRTWDYVISIASGLSGHTFDVNHPEHVYIVRPSSMMSIK